MAKLFDELKSGMSRDEMAEVLLRQHTSTEKTQVMEVHIYGPINRRGIEKVIGVKPTTAADQVIVASVERKLNEVGVPLVVLP